MAIMWLNLECRLWWLRRIFFFWSLNSKWHVEILTGRQLRSSKEGQQQAQMGRNRVLLLSYSLISHCPILLCCLIHLLFEAFHFFTFYLDWCKAIWVTVTQNYLWTVTHLKPSIIFFWVCDVTGSILKSYWFLISSLHTMIPQSCSFCVA